jgi:hypothetical protein
LDQSQQSVYDAVFVNPPYGRLLGLDHPVPADWTAFRLLGTSTSAPFSSA